MKKRVRKNPIPEDIIKLGERIQTLMKKSGMKPVDLAAAAGIETQNLRKYLHGKQEMKVTTLIKVAIALEVQPSALLPKIEYPEKPKQVKPKPVKVYPK